MKKLRSLAATLIIAFAIVTAVSPAAAEAATAKPAKPASVYFVKWTNKDFTGYIYKFKLTQHVDGVQTAFLTSSGVSKTEVFKQEGGLSKGWYRNTVKNSPNDRIVIIYTRAFRYNASGKPVFSAWSKSCSIIPWPQTVSFSLYNASKKQVRAKWSAIDWNDGYNIMMATNPNGNWYNVKSRVKGTSTIINKYRGSSFKKYQNYYVRVITRNVLGGVAYTAPAPIAGFYQNGFRIY